MADSVIWMYVIHMGKNQFIVHLHTIGQGTQIPELGFKVVEGVTWVQVWALEWQEKRSVNGDSQLVDDDNPQDIG